MERGTMYFSEVLGVLVRRWYVLLVGCLLMGGAAGVIVKVVPPNYQASGNVLLLLPATASGDKPVNPYLNVQQGLLVASSIIGGVMTTPEQQRSIYAGGFTSAYAVSQNPGTGVPLLTVSAEDTDGQMAVSTVKEVIRRINAQLVQMQADVNAPAAQTISSREFSVTDQPEAVQGAKVRALAIAVAGIGLLTVLLAFGIDRFRRRPVRRDHDDRERRGGSHSGPASGSLPTATESSAPLGGRPTDHEEDWTPADLVGKAAPGPSRPRH